MKPVPGVFSSSLCLALLLAIAPSPAQACSCLAPGDMIEEASGADAVFAGTVLRLVATDRRADSPLMARIKRFFGMQVRYGPDQRRFALEVDEPFKGIEASTIEVMTSADSASCGYSFQVGRKYLVFAQHDEGRLNVSLCSATAPIDSVPAADLARLRAMDR